MATMTVPTDLYERIQANPRKPGDSTPLTDDEREMVALRLEWLAAEVREKPVKTADLAWDRTVDHGEFPLHQSTAVSPWTYTMTVQMWDW